MTHVFGIIGNKSLTPHTFVSCDFARKTVQAKSNKSGSNCVVKDVFGEMAEIWVEGIARVKINVDDPGSRYQRLPLYPGTSLTSGKNGNAIWADPMSDHPKAILLEEATEIGQVVYVRII